MKKEMLGVVVVAGAVCLMALGCGEGVQTDTQGGTDLSKAASMVKTDLEKAAAETEKAAQQAKMEAEKAAQQAKMEAEKLAQQAQAEAEARTAKLQELLVQAQGYLDSGKLEEAINAAQVVLSQYDPNSSVAQNIITSARAQLQKMAEEKVGAVTEGVMENVGTLGQ